MSPEVVWPPRARHRPFRVAYVGFWRGQYRQSATRHWLGSPSVQMSMPCTWASGVSFLAVHPPLEKRGGTPRHRIRTGRLPIWYNHMCVNKRLHRNHGRDSWTPVTDRTGGYQTRSCLPWEPTQHIQTTAHINLGLGWTLGQRCKRGSPRKRHDKRLAQGPPWLHLCSSQDHCGRRSIGPGMLWSPSCRGTRIRTCTLGGWPPFHCTRR